MKARLMLLRMWLGVALLWAGVVFTANAQPPTGDDFAQANARYATGDFPAAAKAYEREVQTGKFSANLFYNLGNAYFRAGEKGRAVLNYRRALLLEPAHVEAASNLGFITGGKPLADRSGDASGWGSVAAWATAVCGWLGAAGLLTRVASRRWRTLGIAMLVAGWTLCTAGGLTIWFFSGDSRDGTQAVVVTEAASALYSPVEGAKVVTSLPAGGEVRILSEQGAWTYLLLGDGTTRAWVVSKAVERLVPR